MPQIQSGSGVTAQHDSCHGFCVCVCALLSLRQDSEVIGFLSDQGWESEMLVKQNGKKKGFVESENRPKLRLTSAGEATASVMKGRGRLKRNKNSRGTENGFKSIFDVARIFKQHIYKLELFILYRPNLTSKEFGWANKTSLHSEVHDSAPDIRPSLHHSHAKRQNSVGAP